MPTSIPSKIFQKMFDWVLTISVIFREEGLLHFKICSPAEKRRPYGRPCGRCSLCGCELLRGERGWYLNGQSVCADCFPAFARAELAPCETVFGMEGEA